MKKFGGFIPGIRPGQRTAEYIDRVLSRITLAGAIYVAAVCILPTMLIRQFNVPFYFGGTALLIVVGVALDTVAQIETHMLTRSYQGFMRRGRLRGGARADGCGEQQDRGRPMRSAAASAEAQPGMRIVLLGPPGCRKGHAGETHAGANRGIRTSPPATLLRAAVGGRSALGRAAQGLHGRAVSWCPDALVIDMIEQRLQQNATAGEDFMLDGFPRTVAQARGARAQCSADAASRSTTSSARRCRARSWSGA